MSCMNRKAMRNVTPSSTARIRYGTPRLVAWAMKPPSTDPVSIATPETTCALAKTDSSVPAKPLARSASTSHASVAPEKKVNPSPSRIEAIAHPRRPARTCHMTRYRRVAASSVAAPSRNEKRRPRVSATTPVGTSNRTSPRVKNALTVKACVLSSPASRRNNVLMPQMNEADSVVNSVRTR